MFTHFQLYCGVSILNANREDITENEIMQALMIVNYFGESFQRNKSFVFQMKATSYTKNLGSDNQKGQKNGQDPRILFIDFHKIR